MTACQDSGLGSRTAWCRMFGVKGFGIISNTWISVKKDKRAGAQRHPPHETYRSNYQRLGLEPPPLPFSLGLASLTLRLRPDISLLSRAEIACLAPSSISTNPNPLGAPVSRSVMRLTEVTLP